MVLALAAVDKAAGSQVPDLRLKVTVAAQEPLLEVSFLNDGLG